ncbi:MAG: AMP-binding protein [Candidatus Rhabdochlamydia sp.]|mgnify:CR=1|jgi:O-succinylbenzoic acid--CoA ligase|nr:o-succinylbenzoate---CoA ligase [Chlamydiota bacterium]
MVKMLCPIALQAKENPTALAIETTSNSLSYQELDKLLSQLVKYLFSLGITKGARIAFIAPTECKTVILLLALLRMGGIACPINPKFLPMQIDDLTQKLKPSLFINLDTLVFTASSCQIDPIIDTEQLFTFLATSGSSGKSKIACHTFENYLTSALATHLPLQLSKSSRWLLSLPLYHVSGLSILTRCMTIGACVVLTGSKFIWEEIVPHKITHLSCVPTQLFRLKDQKCTLSLLSKQLCCVLVGGAHTSLSLFHSVKELPIFFTYGMTETTSIITLATKEALLSNNVNMGHPISCCEIKIAIDSEILVKGKNLFQGYWNGVQIKPPSLWFATKDLGKILDNHLHIFGRKDRLFISGGENIQPEEIEQALCSIKGIISATVLSKSDEEFGNRPIAFIEDIQKRSFAEVFFELRKILPSFKCPVNIWPYPKHLKNTSVKISIPLLKRHLRSLFPKDAFQDTLLASKEEV